MRGLGGVGAQPISGSQIDRCHSQSFMPEFAADLLPGVLVTHSMVCTELGSARTAHRRRLPPRQRLIPHLRIPMPQTVHVAQPCRLALPVVDVPLLDVGFVRGDQRAQPCQSVRFVQHRPLFRRRDRHRPVTPSSPVASNEASALLPVGRPGGRVAGDDNAMCWDGCLLLCSGGKKLAGRATRDECPERRMCAATTAGRTTPRTRMALPMGRAAHSASLGVPGRFRPVRPGRRLQEPAPGFRYSYPPAGRCWASVPGHRHVRSHQCDAAPTRIPAAVRRAVTAVGSDGPICLTPSPVAPALQQQACFPGVLAAFRCQPCTR